MLTVSISGIDGSGKTTIARELVKILGCRGVNAVYSRPQFQAVKQMEFFFFKKFGDGTLFSQKGDPNIYFHALLSDWLVHSQSDLFVGMPEVVIMDRYIFDVLAQGIHIGANVNNFDWFKNLMPNSDLNIYLDCKVENAFNRILLRDGKIVRHHEQLPELQKLYSIYKVLISDVNWNPLVVSSTDITTVLKTIETQIKSIFSVKKDKQPYPNLTDIPLKCSHCGKYNFT
jgi:thymidylate kinase